MTSTNRTVTRRRTGTIFTGLVFALAVAFTGAMRIEARAASLPIVLAQTTTDGDAASPGGKKKHHRLLYIGGAVVVVAILGGVFFMRSRSTKKA